MLPESWSDISLIDYREILQESESIGMINAFMKHFRADKRMDITEKLNYMWVNSHPRPEKLSLSNIEIEGFRFLPFKKMTLGEFIDIESNMLKGGHGIDRTIAILLRKTKSGEWGEDIFEGREYDIDHRTDVLDNIKVTTYYGIVESITNYINSVTSGFAIFETEEEEGEENEENEDDEANKLKKAFKWSRFVFFAAGGDILRMQDALQTNHLIIFGTLTMQKKLNIKPV